MNKRIKYLWLMLTFFVIAGINNIHVKAAENITVRLKTSYMEGVEVRSESGNRISVNEGQIVVPPGTYSYKTADGAGGSFYVTEDTSEIDFSQVSFEGVYPLALGSGSRPDGEIRLTHQDGRVFTAVGEKEETKFIVPIYKGDSYYNWEFIPKDTDYLTQKGHFYVYQNSTSFLSANLSDSGGIWNTRKNVVTVKAPSGMEVLLTNQLKFYTARNYETFMPYKTEGGYDYYEMHAPVDTSSKQVFMLRDRANKKVTRYGYAENVGVWNEDKSVLTLRELKDNSKQVDKDQKYDANLISNLPESGEVSLSMGEYYDLVPLRAWQAVQDEGGNRHQDPEFHYYVVGDSVEVEITEDDLIGQFGRVKAVKEGVSLVLFSYDAMEWKVSDRSLKDEHGLYCYSALWPELAGVAVVRVGEEESGITPNIDLTDGKYLYYLRSQTSELGHKEVFEEDIVYTFKPESAQGEITAVRVHKPYWVENDTLSIPASANWLTDTNWTIGKKNEDGSYTITLTEGRNIIEIQAGDKKEYFVISAHGLDVVLNNTTNPGTTLSTGDRVTVSIRGAFPSIYKLGAIYNPNSNELHYTVNGTEVVKELGQWDLAINSGVSYVIKEEDVGTLTFSNGYITGSAWGAKPGHHKRLTRNGSAAYWAGGDNPNLDLGKFAVMPDISVHVEDNEDYEEIILRRNGQPEIMDITVSTHMNPATFDSSKFYTENRPLTVRNGKKFAGATVKKTGLLRAAVKALYDEKARIFVRTWYDDDASKATVKEITQSTIMSEEVDSSGRMKKTVSVTQLLEKGFLEKGGFANAEIVIVPTEGSPFTRSEVICSANGSTFGKAVLQELCLEPAEDCCEFGRFDGILEAKDVEYKDEEGGQHTLDFGYGFVATENEFTATVPYACKKILYKPTIIPSRVIKEYRACLEGAEDTVYGAEEAIPLQVGENTLTLTLVPQNSRETENTYKIHIIREKEPALVRFQGMPEGASLLVKKDEKVMSADENGSYALKPGDYVYYVSKKGYIAGKGEFTVAEGETEKVVSVAALAAVPKQKGDVTVRIAGQEAVLCPTSAVKIESFEDMLDLKARGYVQYNYGGYTVLHSLIDACLDRNIAFDCYKGRLTLHTEVDKEGLGADAGWVCEVNGRPIDLKEAADTLAKPDDTIEYYYNSGYDGMLRAWLTPERNRMERRDGESVTLTLYGKNPGEPDDKAKVISNAGIYEGNKLVATTNDDGQTVISSDMFSTLGSHYLTAQKMEGDRNILTATLAMVLLEKDSGSVPEPGKITVTFRLIGDNDHTRNTHGYTTWIKTQEHTFDVEDIHTPSVTVGMVFEKAMKEANLSYEGLELNYISSITAPETCGGYKLAEKQNGKNSGWMYTVNGVHPGEGLNKWYVNSGDEIIWHYIDDYQTEEADRLDGKGGGNVSNWNKWLEAEDETPGAREKAKNLEERMLALVSGENIMPEHAETIEGLRKGYDALSREEKSYVSEEAYTLLIDAERIIQILKDSEAEAAAITELIRSLPGEIQTLQDKINADTTQTDAEETDMQAEVKSGSTGSSLRAKASGHTAVSGRAALSVQSAASRNAYRNMRTYRNTDAYHAYGSFRAMSVSVPITVPDNGEASDGTDGSKESGSSDGNDDGGDPDGAGEADEPGNSDASEDTDGSEDKTDTDIVKETPDREETTGKTDNAEADMQTEDEIFAAIKAVHEKVTEARLRYNRLNGIAKRLIAEDTLQTLVTAETELQALMEKQGADARILKEEIAALPDLDSLTPDDADAVDAVEKAVLHYTAWKDVDTKLTSEEIARCEAAKAAIEKLRNDEKDKEAAREVEAVLSALPQAETPLLSWKGQAEAARKAYDGLTADQQKWVPSELVERLTALEAKLNELETQAKEAKALLEALPPADQVTLEHAQQIEAAKAAYDALSTDQRQLIKKDLSERLTEVTAVLNNLNMEEAGKVLDLIHALPKAEDLTLSHREALEAARKAYDALSEAQKTIFAQDAEGLKTLEALEAKMIVLKEMDYKFTDRIVGLGIGQKAVMTITKGNDPQAVAVTWTSLNPEVATVDESGTVTGVAEGQAKIKATVPADGAEIIGTVNVYPEAPVRIQRGAETLKVGETDRITVTYVPETMGTGATVGYVSSNEELLTVDADGVVTAVGYAGDTPVTVTVIITLADDTRIRETLRYTILPKPEDPGSDSLILYAVKGLDTVLKDIKLPEGFTWISDEATELDQFFGRETRFSARDADGNEITVRVRTASFTASFTKLPEKIGTGLEASEIQAAYQVKGVSQEELAKILEERNLHLTWTFTGMPAGKAEISEIDETAGTAKIRGISPASMTVEATLNADGSLLAKDSRKVTVVDTKGQAAAQVDIRLTVNGEEVQPADGVYVLDLEEKDKEWILENRTEPTGTKITYKSSDPSVIKIGQTTGTNTSVRILKSGYTVVTATANDALKSAQEIRIRVTDRKDGGIRLSSDRMTINLQKGGETLNVYNAFRGRLTKAEITTNGDFTAEAAGDETVRVSVKEGVESPKAGTVRLKVTVEGEGVSHEQEFDLKIAVVNQKPSVTVRQLTNADPFAGKDAKFAIGASGETIEAVLFGSTVELEESDTEDGVWILPASCLTDGTNKGTFTIRLDGYRDAAEKKNVTVKTESPALTLSASSGVVYTKGTDVALGTMQVRILDKKTKAGYDLSGLEAGALTVDEGYQAEVTDEENGLIEITADKAPAGSQKITLTLTGANDSRKTLGFTVKKADIRKAALQLENKSLTFYDYGDLGSPETVYQVYTGLTLKGCGALPEDVAESLEIKNAADDSDVDYVNYDPKTGQIAVKVKGGMITGTENYKVSVTLPKEAFGADDNGNPWLSKNLKVQLKLKLVRTDATAKNLIKKVAAKGKIDVLDRSASGLTLTPSFKNLTTGAKVTDVRLTGEDAHLFKIAEQKENGVVLVQVRPGENVVTKKAYRFGAAYTIVSGGQTVTVATDNAKDNKPYLKVKLTQGKVKAAANGSGSFDNAGGSAPLTFVLTNRSGRRLNVDTERVELTNFTKDFGYDAQSGVLTYHPSGQTASGRNYTLKFKVHTAEGGGNEKPITVKYKVKIAK